jgi:hypothetical protein
MKVFLGALIGAAVAFAWSFVSWMVLGLHDPTIKRLDSAKDQAITATLQTNLGDAGGVYFLPSLADGEKLDAPSEAWKERHRKGPRAMLVYHPLGADPESPMIHVIGFGIDFVAAFLVCLMLSMSGMRSYFTRFGFVGLLGLFAGLVSYVMEINYVNLPLQYAIIMVADLFIGWTVAGFFMAMIVRPR